MCLEARAQSPEYSGAVPPGKLNIGDTIPEYLWHLPLQVVNHPESKETITLDDYRGKLIILDFWATWCSACIKTFPKTESIQKHYDKEVVVLLVTQETMSKTSDYFSKPNKHHPAPALPSVVNDSLFAHLFPHRTIPHVVWIDADGRLIATTAAGELSEGNIAAYLKNKSVQVKNKLNIDAGKQLFLADNTPLDQLQHFSILLKGKIEGLPSGNRFRKKEGTVYGRAVTNLPLLTIYEAIARKLLPGYNRKRLVLGRVDTALLVEPSCLSEEESQTWKRKSYYTYEYNAPFEAADQLYQFMLADLNRQTGLNGRIEKRTVKVLLLTALGDLDEIRSKESTKTDLRFDGNPTEIKNQRIRYLVILLNTRKEIRLPIVDATGYTDAVDLELSGKLDVPSLREDLNRYNLDLEERELPLDVFVLSN